MYTLGIDIGSSSVKVSLLEVESGKCAASFTSPPVEMEIAAPQTGWAEQDPLMWWEHVKICIRKVLPDAASAARVRAIGIAYQMHGLVCVDRQGEPLRRSIIWCDSRAVEIGNRAFEEIGPEKCLEHLLNSPGNFTASKLAWVKENEPQVYARIHKFLLPGDFIMYKLTGRLETSQGGLSEQILWDYRKRGLADLVLEHYGIDRSLVPDAQPCLGVHARTGRETFETFGIQEGTPVSYKSGDQPNNAFSLNVLDHGEIAATAGTSGAVYGVSDESRCDPQSRVNVFVHVNSTTESPKSGVLLCINGIGILNAWMRRNIAPECTYPQINELCREVPAGSDGVLVLPFGNGAERMLGNRFTGACVLNLNLNRHTRNHVLRATQEGIAFAFKYGMDIMQQTGIGAKIVRAGKANLFLSPLFASTLAALANVQIELYDTDGSQGAARGAALGAGLYGSREETFRGLTRLETVQPDPELRRQLLPVYAAWCRALEQALNAK